MLLTITEFIGRFHPVVVHLPIGILLLALLLQLLFRKEPHPAVHRMLKITWITGVASAFVAAITGFLLSVSAEYDDTAVALHMWMGIALLLLSMYLTVRVVNRKFTAADKFSSFFLLLAVMLTGHFGGSLTHGAGYLTGGGQAVADDSAVFRPIASIPEAQVYTEIVQPVLQTRCYNCHGAQRQKGKLRMDAPQHLLKGGKNGEIIVPGSAEESEMIRRILLPKADKKRMPPKKEPQLSSGQEELLQWWVDQGAPFDKKVKELEMTEKVRAYLVALQKNHPPPASISLLPEEPVQPADTKLLEPLRKIGVVILPVAQNSNYLTANFVTASGITAADMQQLLPLKRHLVSIKLGNTTVGDSALAVIGQLTALRLLQLNHASVTDKGLPHLAGLQHLVSLNLVGNRVTLAGLKQLKSLRKLSSLYLYQTGIGSQDTARLQQMFPETAIDLGGYQVPLLPSDTTEVQYKKK